MDCGNGNMTEAEFQASGADPGTIVGKTPAYSVIIGCAKAMLEAEIT
eukprot:SAG31_NODE_37781_length_301_cov_1.103960_1_plen_46_part_01